MAARSGVVDTRGVKDLRVELLSEDHVVAPAHEVVQDSDVVADPSALTHADAAPEHSGDTAATATGDASAGWTAEDGSHAYADVDHAYADATVPDSAFADHSMMLADAGTPHSLGADPAKGQGGDSDKAVWWWAGGAALAGGGIGYWLGHEHNDDDNTTVSSATPDVHVVVERDGAWIDTNGDGVHDVVNETAAAVFGSGGNASLAANDVTIHFNDVPLEALNITGFGADDKIEFHVQSLMDNGILSSSSASYLSDLYMGTNPTFPSAARVEYSFYSGTEITVRHATLTVTDFSGNVYSSVYALSVSSINTDINGSTAAIAYWTDAGNALNDNALLLPNLVTGTNTSTVVANLNANNEGGVVDFIWPSGATIAV